MPYKVFKDGNQWCVHKVDSKGSKGAKVPGGCHDKKSDATSHMKALYSNVPDAVMAVASHEMFEDYSTTLRILAESEAELVDVHDVEIVRTGIEYPLASGPTTFTPEDLADAAEAAKNPNLHNPRIKLGHSGPLAQLTATSDEPAVGTVQNMYVTEDGQKLKGDLIGVPSWLAEILASAYPSRSIEGEFNVEVNGHQYSMVIENLSLLGVKWPGCSSLEDLQALYSKEGPEDVEVIEAQKGEPMGGITASTTAEDVRRAFYEQVATEDRMWWWICAQYVDPPLLIADNGAGDIHSVGYQIGKGDEITFDDPVPVKIQYVETDSGKVAADKVEPAAVFASRADAVREMPPRKGDIRCRVFN